MALAPGELRYDVEYPERLSRLLIFVKWLLVIPHLVVLYFLYIAQLAVTFIAWWAILFMGRYPRGLWDFSMMVTRWSINVNAYYLLQRDEYPPFGEGRYPVTFEMAYPARQSRLLIFVKWLLITPHLVVFWFLAIAYAVVLIIAWFAILLLGRFPRGLFGFAVGVQRWGARIQVYLNLLTDRYPPFSME